MPEPSGSGDQYVCTISVYCDAEYPALVMAWRMLRMPFLMLVVWVATFDAVKFGGHARVVACSSSSTTSVT